MSPDKTGAVIFVEPDNCFYRCDAYSMFGIQYFRITNASADRGVSPEAPYATVKDYADWFDRGAAYSTMICGPFQVENYPK